jgi:hypothetical protein
MADNNNIASWGIIGAILAILGIGAWAMYDSTKPETIVGCAPCQQK